MTSCHEYEVQLALVLPNHLLKLISADELTASFVVFQNKEIALIFVLCVELFPDFLVI